MENLSIKEKEIFFFLCHKILKFIDWKEGSFTLLIISIIQRVCVCVCEEFFLM